MKNFIYMLCLVLPVGMHEMLVHGIVELVVGYMLPLGYDSDYMTDVSKSAVRTFYYIWYGMMILWSVNLIFKDEK